MATAPEEPEVRVTAYSDRYSAAAEELRGTEGGHVNDRLDRGGETNFGISLRFLKAEGAFDEDGDGIADFDLDFDGDIDGADIRELDWGDAKYLYHRCFWQALEAESFEEPIGEMLFDQAVNGGLNAARKLLQRAINACLDQVNAPAIGVDGRIGGASRAALRYVLGHSRLGKSVLVEAFREAVRDRYRAIVARNPSQRRFLRGWLARAERLGR